MKESGNIKKIKDHNQVMIVISNVANIAKRNNVKNGIEAAVEAKMELRQRSKQEQHQH